MTTCRVESLLGWQEHRLRIGRLDSDGYGYTRGYGSGWVVILSTGRVRVRVTVLCYGYGSGSKNAVPADLYYLRHMTNNRVIEMVELYIYIGLVFVAIDLYSAS